MRGTSIPEVAVHPLDIIRFEPEKVLIEELFERFTLEAIVQNYETSGEGEPARELVLSTQLRLTPLLAPRLCALFDEVKVRLRFEESAELFVQSHSDVNGFSLYTLTPDKPHIVSLTSGMIERMSDDELRFVLGHELGHLHFRHHRPRLVYAALAGEEGEEQLPSRIPPLLQRRMESWERLAELSADRAGFVAVEGRLEPVVSAFFKLTSGLGPEHLRFDIEAFLSQLKDLLQMKRREVLAQFSHPVTPVRVRALQLYGEAGGGQLQAQLPEPKKKSRKKGEVEAGPVSMHTPEVQKVDQEVSDLAQLMDFEVTETLDIHARDFLVSAGMLAVHAGDGDMSREEHELLVQLLLPLTADPEQLFVRVGSEEEALKLLKQASDWLRKNAGEERFVLYRQVAHLVAVDGVLDPDEKHFMLQLARHLDIPAKAATRLLYEVLADYLQSRPWDRKLAFKTRPASHKRKRITSGDQERTPTDPQDSAATATPETPVVPEESASGSAPPIPIHSVKARSPRSRKKA